MSLSWSKLIQSLLLLAFTAIVGSLGYFVRDKLKNIEKVSNNLATNLKSVQSTLDDKIGLNTAQVNEIGKTAARLEEVSNNLATNLKSVQSTLDDKVGLNTTQVDEINKINKTVIRLEETSENFAVDIEDIKNILRGLRKNRTTFLVG